jgi:hypothetical protein
MAITDGALMAGICAFFFFIIAFLFAGCSWKDVDFDDDDRHCR